MLRGTLLRVGLPLTHRTVLSSGSAGFRKEWVSSAVSPSIAGPLPTAASTTDDDAEEKQLKRFKPAYDTPLTALPGVYLELSKARLAGLVTLSTMAGYALAPGAVNVPTLLATTVGTALCVASANSMNQWIEVPYDGQMSRTLQRPLVRMAISPLHAFNFSMATALAGTGILYSLVNPLTAVLGACNIILYSMCYTPMKRLGISNTWIGSVVGAIPPMMGWTACINDIDAGALLLGYMLYAWQFPHFNALSWRIKGEYSRAGYRMAVVTDPALNSRVALRYSALLLPTCLAFSYAGVTTDMFAIDSTLVNLALIVAAFQFHKNPSDKSSRRLFFGSLFYLPLILILMLVHKRKRRIVEEVPEGEIEL